MLGSAKKCSNEVVPENGIPLSFLSSEEIAKRCKKLAIFLMYYRTVLMAIFHALMAIFHALMVIFRTALAMTHTKEKDYQAENVFSAGIRDV